MKIWNKLIPVKGFAMMAFWPFIFIRDSEKLRGYQNTRFFEEMINHEKIHLRQQLESMILFLLVLSGPYSMDWISLSWFIGVVILGHPIIYVLIWIFGLIELMFWKEKRPYRHNALEREAYRNQHNTDYLRQRKPFQWLKYL